MTATTDIAALGARWAAAEQAGDTDTLAALTVEDFTLVGPLGFVLDRDQWLLRYRDGSLVTESLTWTPESVRTYGPVAVVIGTHEQQARYQGNPVPLERMRATHVLTADAGGEWKLAGIHLSPISAPPRP